MTSAVAGRRFREFSRRPMIHLMATMACNLRCSYCPVERWLLDEPTDQLLSNPRLHEIIANAPEPLAFTLSGGEPLLNPQTVEFVARYGAEGHMFAFDTNGTINRRRLAAILDQWDPEWIGFFHISHHLDQRVPIKTMIATSEEMRARGFNHYVKYIGRPSDRAVIDASLATLEAHGVGACVMMYAGFDVDPAKPDGPPRTLPGDYGDDDLDWLLGHVRALALAMPIAGGLKTMGRPCRAGNEILLIGDFDDGAQSVWTCAHGYGHDIELASTYIGGGTPGCRTCRFGHACYIHHHVSPEEYDPIYGHALSDIFDGPAPPAPPRVIADYLRRVTETVAPPADPALFERVLARLAVLDRREPVLRRAS